VLNAQVVRTGDERFASLPDWPFEPRYLDDLAGYEGLRVHFVDEGGATKPTFLFLHGEPTWSYLYRKMIPVFARAGRAVAVDFLGFGRSDKPVDDALYSFDFHRAMLLRFVERLDLRNVVMICHDWGGLLGLTLPPEMPERFTGLLATNTTFAIDGRFSDGFRAWREWAATHPDMDVGALMGRTVKHLSPEERAAYAAPFPDLRSKAGVRRFPQLVPDRSDAGGVALSRAAREWWRSEWSGTSVMAIGMRDPVLTPDIMYGLHRNIRNCPPPMEIAEAGHFVPEWSELFAERALGKFT
jgi:pimeloyl-ACP methyl ester carboxylesterase